MGTRRRGVGIVAASLAVAALGYGVFLVPISSGPTMVVRKATVTADHYVFPMSMAYTHVWVEAQYRPRTIWRFLVGPKITDNGALVEAVRTTVSKGWRLPNAFGGGIFTDQAAMAAVGDDILYKWSYHFKFVGTGTLRAWPSVDGQTLPITVPFDDRQKVPRPADAQRLDW